jgi:hypothetical protein
MQNVIQGVQNFIHHPQNMNGRAGTLQVVLVEARNLPSKDVFSRGDPVRQSFSS